MRFLGPLCFWSFSWLELCGGVWMPRLDGSSFSRACRFLLVLLMCLTPFSCRGCHDKAALPGWQQKHRLLLGSGGPAVAALALYWHRPNQICESHPSRLDLPDPQQLLSHPAGVAATMRLSPLDDGVVQDGSKSTSVCWICCAPSNCLRTSLFAASDRPT